MPQQWENRKCKSMLKSVDMTLRIPHCAAGTGDAPANCEDQVEWNFYGPFKTERQARRDAKRDQSKRTAAYCITAAVTNRQKQTADEQLVDLELVSINARTAEAAAAIELSQTLH
jgi:hypothetical protein